VKTDGRRSVVDSGAVKKWNFSERLGSRTRMIPKESLLLLWLISLPWSILRKMIAKLEEGEVERSDLKVGKHKIQLVVVLEDEGISSCLTWRVVEH
jgi:hypothetical protein